MAGDVYAVPIASDPGGVPCDTLPEQLYELSPRDRHVFCLVYRETAPVTVDAVAAFLDRERTTAHRALTTLLEAGLLRRRRVRDTGGGHRYEYFPLDADTAADRFLRRLNRRYRRLERAITALREQHDGDEWRPDRDVP